MGASAGKPDQANSIGTPPQAACFFLYGNICIDHVYDCATYPAEDSGQRALSARKVLGGNGANSSRVLAQLCEAPGKVCLMGAVPRLDETDTAFTVATLKASGVATEFLEEVGGNGMPTSFALTSRQTGSRTIVSTRNAVREMSPEHLVAVASKVFAAKYACPWCHLECRQPLDVMLKMVQAWQHAAESQGAAGSIVSFEVEKPTIDPDKVLPILKLCDYVFFSQNFAEQHHDLLLSSTEITEATSSLKADLLPPSQERDKDELEAGALESWQTHKALCFLRLLCKRAAADRGVWTCTWGEHGAFALDTSSGKAFYEPAHLQEHVVDSVGAGDTFNAAFIHATSSGSDPQAALHFACEVAGAKVGQVGFEGLLEKLPPSMRRQQ